jgi:hypothetical protein
MSLGEKYYFALVLVAFTAFGVTLALESWLEGRHSRHQ